MRKGGGDETTADERHVYLDALARNTQRFGDGFRGCGWNLRWRPEFARIAANVGGAIDGFHRSVGEERHSVDGFGFLPGGCASLFATTITAADRSPFRG